MAYPKYSVGEKIKLTCGSVVVAGALAFGGAKLYSLGNIPPQCRETSSLIVAVSPPTQSEAAVDVINVESLLSHQAASGYSRLKKQLVDDGRAIADDALIDKSVPLATAVESPPLQIEAMHC